MVKSAGTVKAKASTVVVPKAGKELARSNLVRIHGLSAAPQFNNKLGTLKEFDAAKSRWIVEFSSGELHRLKPDNLQLSQAKAAVPVGKSASSCVAKAGKAKAVAGVLKPLVKGGAKAKGRPKKQTSSGAPPASLGTTSLSLSQEEFEEVEDFEDVEEVAEDVIDDIGQEDIVDAPVDLANSHGSSSAPAKLSKEEREAELQAKREQRKKEQEERRIKREAEEAEKAAARQKAKEKAEAEKALRLAAEARAKADAQQQKDMERFNAQAREEEEKKARLDARQEEKQQEKVRRAMEEADAKARAADERRTREEAKKQDAKAAKEAAFVEKMRVQAEQQEAKHLARQEAKKTKLSSAQNEPLVVAAVPAT